jgi:hypothetical protein
VEFGPTINGFADNLSALREFVLQVGSLLDERKQDVYERHREDLTPFALALNALDPNFKMPEAMTENLKALSDKVKIVKEEGKRGCQMVFKDAELGGKFLAAMKEVNARGVQESLLYSSSLISLISAAEWFVSRLIQAFFEKFPDTAKTQEKVFSLDDLKGFGSIADAQRHLIEMRVGEIMWGSLDDWIKFLKTKMNLSMGYVTPHLDELTEIFQRRNVVVHNNSAVHSSYLAKVAPELRKGISVGDKLAVPPEYLIRAIDIIELDFILVGAELWKKLDPNDAKRGRALIDEAFTGLVAERWAVAEGISYFVMLDKGLPERDRLIGQLNYWQSLKWQGQFDKIKPDVEEADFSAKDELFQLGRLALLSETKPFFDLLPSVIHSEKLTCAQLRDWPIFREMRKCEEYRKFYEEHRKDFEPVGQEEASVARTSAV